MNISKHRVSIFIALTGLFLFFQEAKASQTIITASIAITNTSGTSNGQTISVNSNLRTWTNSVSSTVNQMLTSGTISGSTTNLYSAYSLFPESGMSLTWNSSNTIVLTAFPSDPLTVILSSGWGTVNLVTNTIGNAVYNVRVPFVEATPIEKTNVESGLATYLGDNAGTNKVGTNAPIFSPWYNWIVALTGSLSPTNVLAGYIQNSNGIGTNITFVAGFPPFWPVQFTTPTVGNGIWALGNITKPGVPGAPFLESELDYLNGSYSNNGVAYPFGLTYVPSISINGATYDGIAIQAPIGYFHQLYVDGLPVGTGGGSGGNTTNTIISQTIVTAGSVGTLYSTEYNPSVTPSYSVTNVVISSTPSYLGFNNTYYPSSQGQTYSINYGGNSYTYWQYYTNGNYVLGYNLIGVTPGTGSYRWNLYLANGTNYYFNNTFSLIDPSFNSGWNTLGPTPEPVLNALIGAGTVSTNATISWNLGDNWKFNIAGTNSFTLSLAQDWRAANISQVEFHKIFLTSVTNCSVAFSQGTDQWFWQNRQGLAAQAPSTIASNETVTISLNHIGGQTNWLATWDTSAATNGISSGSTNSGSTLYSATFSYVPGQTNYILPTGLGYFPILFGADFTFTNAVSNVPANYSINVGNIPDVYATAWATLSNITMSVATNVSTPTMPAINGQTPGTWILPTQFTNGYFTVYYGK